MNGTVYSARAESRQRELVSVGKRGVVEGSVHLEAEKLLHSKRLNTPGSKVGRCMFGVGHRKLAGNESSLMQEENAIRSVEDS
ncbi:hypothetical protein MMC20_003308, partial [Loxospora ochrophaea]|nr:hypothetical protein [Loxospora ochrophaea]